jgi:hypothetical protein
MVDNKKNKRRLAHYFEPHMTFLTKNKKNFKKGTPIGCSKVIGKTYLKTNFKLQVLD